MMKIQSLLFVIGLLSLACKEDTPTQSGGTKCPSAISYGGKTYTTVEIGNQCWMKEYLNIGTMINSLQDAANDSVIEKYCYNNSTANCAAYGGLYQWNEVMQYTTTPGARGICPPGWHIPTAAEFDTLRSAVHNDGNALKAVGQGTGDGAGTNTSGFSALLAGLRYDVDGGTYTLGADAHFWSSTESAAATARNVSLYYDEGGIYIDYYYTKMYGFSVRCLEDQTI